MGPVEKIVWPANMIRPTVSYGFGQRRWTSPILVMAATNGGLNLRHTLCIFRSAVSRTAAISLRQVAGSKHEFSNITFFESTLFQ
jgi:hypothetical protein